MYPSNLRSVDLELEKKILDLVQKCLRQFFFVQVRRPSLVILQPLLVAFGSLDFQPSRGAPLPWTPTTRGINPGVVRGSFTKLGPTPCSSPCKGSYYKKKCNAERISMYQVWSLTQFYSVDLSQSRFYCNK